MFYNLHTYLLEMEKFYFHNSIPIQMRFISILYGNSFPFKIENIHSIGRSVCVGVQLYDINLCLWSRVASKCVTWIWYWFNFVALRFLFFVLVFRIDGCVCVWYAIHKFYIRSKIAGLEWNGINKCKLTALEISEMCAKKWEKGVTRGGWRREIGMKHWWSHA